MNCGKIYRVENEISLDKMYIYSYCPCCEHKRALVLGDNMEDIYELYDVNLDNRYY